MTNFSGLSKINYNMLKTKQSNQLCQKLYFKPDSNG